MLNPEAYCMQHKPRYAVSGLSIRESLKETASKSKILLLSAKMKLKWQKKIYSYPVPEISF